MWRYLPVIFLSFFGVFLNLPSAGFSGLFVEPQEIQAKISDAQKFYQKKQQSLEKQVNQIFQVDYAKLMTRYQTTLQELNFKVGLLNQMNDASERGQQLAVLQQEYAGEFLQKAMEVRYYFQNEIEQDHEFVGVFLKKLEETLDLLVQKDPLFSFILSAPDFRNQYGLVLKQVVWQIQPGAEVSAQTVPLNVYSLFADKARTPLLIKVTPVAFKSQAFLQSILIHELNHVLMFKDPLFLNTKPFEGGGAQGVQSPVSHYFSQLSPANPSYQFYLIHEYYSFKAQMIFDERIAPPALKLDAVNRAYFEKIGDWTYRQLNDRNKKFVEEHPDPVILPWFRRFYTQHDHV